MKKISERKRIVVKVGTSTLTHKTGRLNISEEWSNSSRHLQIFIMQDMK